MLNRAANPLGALVTALRFALAGWALLATLSCGPQAAEEATTAPSTLQAPQLNLSFAALPADLEVTAIGERIELRSLQGEGTITVEVGAPSDFGIEVTTIANEEKAAFETMPNGAFSGVRKLTTPIGEGAYARGRFDTESGRWEETKVFVVHPTENRLVTFRYRYPAAEDSTARIQTLLDLVAETQALQGPPSETQDAATDA